MTLYIASLVFLLAGYIIPVRSFLLPSRNRKTGLYSSAPPTIADVSFRTPPFAADTADGTYPSPLHSIHIKSILTDEECQKCLLLAREYAQGSGRWDYPDTDRHSTYATCDFVVEDCQTLASYLHDIEFDDRIWNELSKNYGVELEDMTYLDLFCANYHVKTQNSGPNTMDRLEAHRDGSLLSFTLTLTDPSEFEGGGTFVDALRDVEADEAKGLRAGGIIRPNRAGDAVLHSGKLLHGADVITAGERTVLVGFVDVADWCVRSGVLGEACRDWGRMDVAEKRYQRQQDKTSNGQSDWRLNDSRWLGQGPSRIRGYVPAFDSVRRRSEPEYQRRKKLEAEDIFLRNALLPEPESRMSAFGDDITLL